eukprot:scaffold2930_cov376-Prasinococcus_capsulatus_cf.AAC.10
MMRLYMDSSKASSSWGCWPRRAVCHSCGGACHPAPLVARALPRRPAPPDRAAVPRAPASVAAGVRGAAARGLAYCFSGGRW